jgi:hypothetical protein
LLHPYYTKELAFCHAPASSIYVNEAILRHRLHDIAGISVSWFAAMVCSWSISIRTFWWFLRKILVFPLALWLRERCCKKGWGSCQGKTTSNYVHVFSSSPLLSSSPHLMYSWVHDLYLQEWCLMLCSLDEGHPSITDVQRRSFLHIATRNDQISYHYCRDLPFLMDCSMKISEFGLTLSLGEGNSAARHRP